MIAFEIPHFVKEKITLNSMLYVKIIIIPLKTKNIHTNIL